MYLHAATLMPIKPLSILSYPGGDVPLKRGVCTDVVLRAYRQPGPDRNIDHRRVPNPGAFFAPTAPACRQVRKRTLAARATSSRDVCRAS